MLSETNVLCISERCSPQPLASQLLQKDWKVDWISLGSWRRRWVQEKKGTVIQYSNFRKPEKYFSRSFTLETLRIQIVNYIRNAPYQNNLFYLSNTASTIRGAMCSVYKSDEDYDENRILVPQDLSIKRNILWIYCAVCLEN